MLSRVSLFLTFDLLSNIYQLMCQQIHILRVLTIIHSCRCRNCLIPEEVQAIANLRDDREGFQRT